MALQFEQASNAEQSVQKAGVSNVNLGCFELAFAKVDEPGGELPYQQGIGKGVYITAGGGLGYFNRSSDTGPAPTLSVLVGQHGPESPHGIGRKTKAKARQVALQEGADVVVSPLVGVHFPGA